MRFRGGGVGHMYMRQVEPWLDATGWGATWPSLEDREPEDQGCDPSITEGTNAEPITSPQDGGSGDENSDDDIETGEFEDDDGDDPEQPEDSEDDCSDEETGGNGNKSKRTGGGGDESEDEADMHHL